MTVKKFILMSIFIILLLLVGCNSSAYAEVEEYTGSEVSYEEEIEEEIKYEVEVEHLIEPNVCPKNAVAISAASDHTLALMEDGSLWAWGASFNWGIHIRSQIGDGTDENRPLPVKIMEDVAFAMAGPGHSFAITTNGVLWAWGDNWYGQLGDGTTENRLSPVKIMDDVVYAAMMQEVPNSHAGPGGRSYAIRSDGSLWAWGQGDGQGAPFSIALGDGGSGNHLLPVQILENVRAVLPTSNGGFAITNDNTLWHWHGEIVLFDYEDGEWARTEFEGRPRPEPILEDVASISGAFAVTIGGELWQITFDGPVWIMDGVIYATGFAGTNFAITTEGTLLGWGRNRLPSHWREGPILGDGTTEDRDTPVVILEDIAKVRIMGNNVYALANDGILWTWGTGMRPSLYFFEDYMWEYAYDDRGFPSGKRWLSDDDTSTGIRLSPVAILDNVAYVAPIYHQFDHGWVYGPRAFALTHCGSVWAWGVNDRFDHGVSFLGDGSSENRPYPVRIIEGK